MLVWLLTLVQFSYVSGVALEDSSQDLNLSHDYWVLGEHHVVIVFTVISIEYTGRQVGHKVQPLKQGFALNMVNGPTAHNKGNRTFAVIAAAPNTSERHGRCSHVLKGAANGHDLLLQHLGVLRRLRHLLLLLLLHHAQEVHQHVRVGVLRITHLGLGLG